MVIPLTWDEDGITECAFVTRAFYRGKAVDQLHMHLKGGMGYSADESCDALINEIDLSKMHVFLSDVLFDRQTDGNKSITIPFGKQDCTPSARS